MDLGRPQGREAGFYHPAIVVTAQRILDAGPSVVQVVPLTTRSRAFATDITIEPDSHNGLTGIPATPLPSRGEQLGSSELAAQHFIA
ncbi:MAG TPA: type II toxin-antitoxin system PemK/MazF family toxin [Actinomycetota bacterium]|nr:type II toxin-antitoxin system PemK/MazF family toxin [Actinomycetota bacterium]